MASNKDYLTFVLEQLSDLDDISYRAMMGEYILYFRGKIIGGIYDDRLLVKPVQSAISLMPTATYELPYEGAKEMLLVEDIDNREFLCNLFLSMYEELPARANLWSDEQKSHMRSCMRVRLPATLKPNNYTESCMINEADGWRGRNVWYLGRSVRYALKEVTIA